MNPWETPPSGAAAAEAARFAALVPVIETWRLRLRAPRMEDFPSFAEIFAADSEGWIGGPHSRESAFNDFCRTAGRWLLRGSGVWAVERLLDNQLLGFVILDMEWGDPELELGYLFLPEFEGQGYATEAARAAREHAFTRLGLDTVVSCVAEGHERSARLAERLGATPAPEYAIPAYQGTIIYRHVREGASA